MRARILTIILCLTILNSCIVKSLHPFYTQKTISFEEKFIGEWVDTKKGKWVVISFKKEFLKENNVENPSLLKQEDFEFYTKYKDGYFVSYTENDKESLFLAMPFTINNQLFIDFTPLDFNSNVNDLINMHQIMTHSLVKFDILNDNEISIKWFDESKIINLFNDKKIKIKHEKVGIDENILLTASSIELEKFIKKYMASKDQEKWKTDIKFNLKRVNEK